MSILHLLFWLSLGFIAYTYVGNLAVLVLASGLRQLYRDWCHASTGKSRRVEAPENLPGVAVLVAAYNEERHIYKRVHNILQQLYPADRQRLYGASWVAWSRARSGVTPKLLRIPLFFVSMNLALPIGFCRHATGSLSGAWARSAR